MSEREPEPARGGEPEPVDHGAASVEALTAVLRREAADLQIYARVLSVSLAEALPPGSVALERKRSMSDRLAGRDGRVERVEISLDDQRLILSLAHGAVTGVVAKVARGIVLSRRPVPLDEWTTRLATAIAQRARSDARARAALEKFVLGG